MRIPSASERKKTSELMKRRWQDPEYRKQMSEKHKGQKVSEEGCMSRFKALKGIKRSDKTKRKMSESAKMRPDDYYEAMHEGNKRWRENETVSERMERLQKWMQAGREARINKDYLEPSSIEIIVQEQLDSLGIRYLQQKRVNDGNRDYWLDFYIPSLKLVIECNGDYWHSLPERKERDKKLKEYVKSTGRKIVFIWEHEIKDEWFQIEDYLEGGDAK